MPSPIPPHSSEAPPSYEEAMRSSFSPLSNISVQTQNISPRAPIFFQSLRSFAHRQAVQLKNAVKATIIESNKSNAATHLLSTLSLNPNAQFCIIHPTAIDVGGVRRQVYSMVYSCWR